MSAVMPRRLQLGAFDQAVDGWVNTDVTPQLLVARVPGLPWLLHRLGVIDDHRWQQHRQGLFRALRWLDVSRRFRFPDGSFEAIYCSHLLEHLHTDVAENCLREAHRVLIPGGVLRIAVPDLDNMVSQYDPADPDRWLYGIFQGCKAADRQTARHWWHYNARSLEALLRRVGFSEIAHCRFREGRCPDLELIETREWSLFMEAVR